MSEYNGVVYVAAPPAGVERDPNQVGDATPLIVITSIFLPLATAATVIRLYTRTFIVGNVSLDDYLMLGALLTSVLCCYFSLIIIKYGLGKDIWNVPLEPDMYPLFTFNDVLSAFFYCISTGLAKGSILLFYLRIFPGKTMRVWVWIVFGFTLGYSIACGFTIVFACRPVAGSWDVELAAEAQCINVGVFYYCQAALAILTDIATVVLPLPVLRSLRLPKKQKIGVAVVLTMGASVCVVSILRLPSLASLMDDPNQTYNTVIPLMYCVLELNLSILGGSIPTVKPFVKRLMPRLLDSSGKGTSPSGEIQLGNPSGYKRSAYGHGSQVDSSKAPKSSSSTTPWLSSMGGKRMSKKYGMTTSIAGIEGGSDEYINIDDQAITKTVEYGFSLEDVNRQNKHRDVEEGGGSS